MGGLPFGLSGGVGAGLKGGFRKLRATEWFFLGWRSACDQAADLCAGAKFSASSAGWRNFHRYGTIQHSTALAARAVRPEIAHRARIQPVIQPVSQR